MDFFTHYSDPSNSSSEANAQYSDEEVILASAHPKKRAGRRVFKETRHPVYRGVRRRNNDKWVCEVRVPNDNKSRIWLGTYSTPEKAARAHDVAALALRGRSACLNFADSAWRLPVPSSTDPEEIRRVAVQAAEAFEDELGAGTSVPAVCSSEIDDQVLMSMVDEPLRSPPHHLVTRGWDSNPDVEFDAEVSLWSFTA